MNNEIIFHTRNFLHIVY